MGDVEKEISLVELKVGQAVLSTKLDNLKDNLDNKHTQNRNSIHDINGHLDTLGNDLWRIKLKIAGYASIGGVVSTIVAELIKYLVSLTHK